MRKNKRITRTVTFTLVTAKIANLKEEKIAVADFKVLGSPATKEKVLKAAKEEFDNDEMKVLEVIAYSKVCDKYGMSERTFLENAYLIDKKSDNEPCTDNETLPDYND